MEDLVRNFLGLIFLIGADVILLSVFVALIVANYLACKSAFDFSGYDGLPLANEAFIGQIIGPFFPEATLSHFYALVVAVVIALGLFILTYCIFYIWVLMRDQKAYLAQNDSQSAQIILNKMHETMLLIAIIIPCLASAINWDFQLFLYRSVVGALGIEDPSQAPLTVLNWERQMEVNGNFFAWHLARIGAFGYLGITGVACIALEFTFRRTTERLLILISNIESIFISTDQHDERTPYGYDSRRQPVYDPAVPVAYDVSWTPVILHGYDSGNYPVYDPQTPITFDTARNPITIKTDPEVKPATDKDTSAASQEHHHREEIRTQPTPPNAIHPRNSESPQDQRTTGMHNTESDGTNSPTAVVAPSGPSDDSQCKPTTDPEVGPSSDTNTTTSSKGHHQHTADINRTEREGTGTPNAGVSTSGRSNDSQTSLFDDEEAFQSLGYRRSEYAQQKEVIGNPGERVSLAAAMADKEHYWVDPDSLEIWDFGYRRLLFPETF